MFKRAAAKAHELLKGARVGEQPIERPSTFELVISLRAAKSLGLAISPSLLSRADRVID
jgi:putative ABC transport system substrate-binding protein